MRVQMKSLEQFNKGFLEEPRHFSKSYTNNYDSSSDDSSVGQRLTRSKASSVLLSKADGTKMPSSSVFDMRILADVNSLLSAIDSGRKQRPAGNMLPPVPLQDYWQSKLDALRAQIPNVC
jgi:hypothetical protein